MADGKKRRGLGVDALFPAGRPENQSTRQPVDQPTGRTVDQPTSELVKVTVYLPEDAEEKLDRLWRQLQRRAGAGNRRKVTKGDLLALALETALGQWKEEDFGRLAGELVNRHTSRTADQ